MSGEFYTIKDGGDKKVPKGKISLTTEIVIRKPQFCESLMETMARIRSGKMEWHRYDEVF